MTTCPCRWTSHLSTPVSSYQLPWDSAQRPRWPLFWVNRSHLGTSPSSPPNTAMPPLSLGLDSVKYLWVFWAFSCLSLLVSQKKPLLGSFPRPRAKMTDRSVLRPGVANSSGHRPHWVGKDLGSHLNSPGNSAGPSVMSPWAENLGSLSLA